MADRPGATVETEAGSFRDPAGFVFQRDGVLYRQVNRSFETKFASVRASGLFDDLARERLLVPHQEVGPEHAAGPDAVAVLRPERIGFISYPYEWSFGQLKDAALLTLAVQERALERGFTLRDASAYNVQFSGGRPMLIDTLSLEPREEGAPWLAYRQFCEHFLVPLLLMSRVDIGCGSLLRAHLDGIPLELGSHLLPWHSRLRPGTLMHVHLHAAAQRRYADTSPSARVKSRPIGKTAAIALVHSLRGAIARLTWQPSGTEWADYPRQHNYSDSAIASKRALVARLLRGSLPRVVWDLGANTGEYSRVAREVAESVIAFDIDPAAVERNYRGVRASNEEGILPLLADLANPSPALGWAHRERRSLEQRGPADALLALALVHHLAIGRNVPLERIAEYFARLGRALVIEFVPKSDTQVQRLLRSREDVFVDYHREGFEAAFGRHFRIEAAESVTGSERTMYAMTALGRA
ncbi:MAG TPA: class I SAM-dependent methyltransferase [Gemmatimonadales bacterium]|nr:class I SAM-dependent methyltransferase [Gemmatimonadales bacterium]